MGETIITSNSSLQLKRLQSFFDYDCPQRAWPPIIKHKKIYLPIQSKHFCVKTISKEFNANNDVIKEYTNQEIADSLYISKRTVDAHKRNLLEKTGTKNIAGLVMFALNNQLFDDQDL